MGKPRIGMVGYYGYGNYGDELFLEVFGKYLSDFEFVFLQDQLQRPFFTKPLDKKVETLDAILIGGGDIVIPNYWSDQYFEDVFLRKPVYIHGVGVPTWGGEDPNVVSRLAKFFKHENVRSIHVRDFESRAWIQHKLAPRIAVDFTADIVCALDLPQIPPQDGPKIFGLVTRKQKPGEIHWQNVRALCDRAKSLGYRIRHISLGTGAIGKEDQVALAEFGYTDMELVESESISDLNRAIGECAQIASMKFHGCVVGIMFGIPAIGLITTDKFRNFYKVAGRPELLAHHTHTDLASRLRERMEPIPTTTVTRLRNDAHAGLERLKARMLKDLGTKT
jgi:polysaccharide pyruvyl transferase WcaK-like protein